MLEPELGLQMAQRPELAKQQGPELAQQQAQGVMSWPWPRLALLAQPWLRQQMTVQVPTEKQMRK